MDEEEEEIHFEDLTPQQQDIAYKCLKDYRSSVVYWGRQSGKSFLARYLVQEFRKLAAK